MLEYDVLFCFVDDFCHGFVPFWQKLQLSDPDRSRKRNRSTRLHMSEIVTIMIGYHESGYRCFKDYYRYVLFYHRREFPHLVSYDRFISLMRRSFSIVMILFAVLRGEVTDIMFADSMPYAVCKTVRRYAHQVFKGLASLSKNSVGWFYGLKLHFLFNDQGEIVRLSVTSATCDDRQGLRGLVDGLKGKIYADRGYLGKDFAQDMWQQGIEIITRLRHNMRQKLMPLWDRFYLGKRMTIETIFSSIKSCGTFEHARHRSVTNAFCHIFCAMISYQIRPLKTLFRPNMPELNM